MVGEGVSVVFEGQVRYLRYCGERELYYLSKSNNILLSGPYLTRDKTSSISKPPVISSEIGTPIRDTGGQQQVVTFPDGLVMFVNFSYITKGVNPAFKIHVVVDRANSPVAVNTRRIAELNSQSANNID